MKKCVLGLFVCFIIVGPLFGQSVADMAWIVGDWTTANEDTITTESWSYMNDSTMVGSSVSMKQDSIVFEEALRIESRKGKIRYVALLPFKLATFRSAKISKTAFSFFDPNNDFPSKVTYLKTKKGMTIRLEGKNNRQELHFIRPK